MRTENLFLRSFLFDFSRHEALCETSPYSSAAPVVRSRERRVRISPTRSIQDPLCACGMSLLTATLGQCLEHQAAVPEASVGESDLLRWATQQILNVSHDACVVDPSVFVTAVRGDARCTCWLRRSVRNFRTTFIPLVVHNHWTLLETTVRHDCVVIHHYDGAPCAARSALAGVCAVYIAEIARLTLAFYSQPELVPQESTNSSIWFVLAHLHATLTEVQHFMVDVAYTHEIIRRQTALSPMTPLDPGDTQFHCLVAVVLSRWTHRPPTPVPLHVGAAGFARHYRQGTCLRNVYTDVFEFVRLATGDQRGFHDAAGISLHSHVDGFEPAASLALTPLGYAERVPAQSRLLLHLWVGAWPDGISPL